MSLAFPATAPDFDRLVVSESNRSAVGVVRQPGKWPTPILCLIGPPASGRSTILAAWCAEKGGTLLQAGDVTALKAPAIAALAPGFVAVDDADQATDGDRLLTLINQVAEAGGRLLLSAQRSPSQWLTRSADLKSRLNSMPLAEIMPPDETMLKGRLMMAAARHYLKLEEDIIAYLAPRLDLSYEAIEQFAEKLSHGVTSTGRAPSVPLAKEVLEAMGLSSPEQPPQD
ncbi:MAG: hypothetical protein KDA53_07375 [Hyphomonas sp.]|nr:hypothetical protein [Hyphomonas sp.]